MDDTDPPRDNGVSEQSERSRKGGRPEYKPTDEQRALVTELVAGKTARIAIARRLGISPVTLRKHFAAELGFDPAPALPGLGLEGEHEPARLGPGRPGFEPTWRQREDVKLLKADDWSDERIARYLGISRNTLLAHFADELEAGADQVRARVLRDLSLASSKGSAAASDRLLKLPGMIAPAQQLPVPESAAPEPVLGKKAQANRDAQTAHQGTSWNQILN